jgi:hypothetical protein
MRELKRYCEWGNYFIEIRAENKRRAERVMRKLERAIKKLYAVRNRGTGIIEWSFDAPEGALDRVWDEEE